MIDLSSYRRPALQFSGGKDSLACLYLLREQLQGLTVYWCDTQDAVPETRQIVEQVREWIPNFRVVQSDAPAWRREHGLPSDIVTASNHLMGRLYGLKAHLRVSNRFDCCYQNIMLPLHLRMLEDGVDCVVRGTKLADTGQLPCEGFTPYYTVLLPLRDWTHVQVFEFLEKVGAPVNPVYQYGPKISAPECLGCTAWWEDGRMRYLKAEHPELVSSYSRVLRQVRVAVRHYLGELEQQLGECDND